MRSDSSISHLCSSLITSTTFAIHLPLSSITTYSPTYTYSPKSEITSRTKSKGTLFPKSKGTPCSKSKCTSLLKSKDKGRTSSQTLEPMMPSTGKGVSYLVNKFIEKRRRSVPDNSEIKGCSKKNVTRQRSRSVPNLLKEQPTVQKMQHWCAKFQNLLEDEEGREMFREFLRKEYCEENLLFWISVEKARTLFDDSAAYMLECNAIYLKFVKHQSEYEINISGGARKKIEEHVEKKTFTESMFDAAQKEVYMLMNRHNYPRFILKIKI